MTATTRRLIGSWLTGMLVGTGVIATTSPWFVRSYLPLHADPTRGVWTLPPDHWYRWRSEGYADTFVGPLGMPGKQAIEPRRRDAIRVALWGDSQAEGVCVADRDKLFAQAETIADGHLQVFPLARSGEDAADWLTQMPAVERVLDLDFHVILAVDLQDLVTATQAPLPPPSQSDVAAAEASIAARFPAFVIQAARHLLTESDETTPRRLRFSVGPRQEVEVGQVLGAAISNAASNAESPSADASLDQPARWRREMQAIRAASSLPILILHAPVIPQIVNGRIIRQTVDGTAARVMQSAAKQAGIQVASAESQLLQSALDGHWPHGFDNGYIGSGHLNKVGNQVVAAILAQQVLDQMESNTDVERRERGQESKTGTALRVLRIFDY